MTRFRARAAVFLLTLAFACAAAAPALASQATVATRGQAAVGWLARRMVQGSHFVTVYKGTSYPNQGETIDAILAFAATKSANEYGARAIEWLERPGVLADYIGSGAESYAGATAKVALAAEVRGINPAHFGKVNLITRLSRLLAKSGRYSDHSPYGDSSNAFSQSLAIIALSRYHGAGFHGVPANAVKFLASSECENGGFPLDFGQKTCAADNDATAMDVQALLAVGDRPAAVRGLKWLVRVQQRNGGFDETAGAPLNANSTGLAGEALAAGGRQARAALAARFLLSLQVGCSAKSWERGAMAYDRAGFVKSTAIDATAQGILGLADISLATISARGSSNGAPRLACAG